MTNRYVAKATYMRDKNGLNYTVEELICDGSHEGTSSPILDSTQLKALETRVTTLETTNGNINDRIDSAESTATEAKRTAEIAHEVANEVSEGYDMLNSMASNAETKAVEAKNLASSIASQYETLKNRVSNLEEMDGQASVPNVGKSTMGYTSNFSEYEGGSTKHVEWGDEGRTIGFSDESLLGDVLEEIIYYTTAGISANYAKIQALQNNSGGGSDSGNCLDQSITFAPFEKLTDEQMAVVGIPDRSMTQTETAKNCIVYIMQNMPVTMTEVIINQNKIKALEETVSNISGGSDSGDCLNTEITTKPYEQISLEAALVWPEVSGGEPVTKTVSDWIVDAVKTANQALGETKNNLDKIQAINGGSSSDGTLYMIGRFDAGKNAYNKYEFLQPKITTSYELPDILAVIDANSSTMTTVVGENLERLNTLETKASNHTNSISSLESRMTDAETTLSGLKVNNSNCNCDVSKLQADCQELSTYTTTNFSNVYAKLKELRTQMIADLDYIWSQIRSVHDELPEMNTNAANAWNVSNVTLEF